MRTRCSGNCSASKRRGHPLPVTIRIHFATHPILHPPLREESAEGKTNSPEFPSRSTRTSFVREIADGFPLALPPPPPCLPIRFDRRSRDSAPDRAHHASNRRINPMNTDAVVSVIDRPPPIVHAKLASFRSGPASIVRDTVTKGLVKRGAIKRDSPVPWKDCC